MLGLPGATLAYSNAGRSVIASVAALAVMEEMHAAGFQADKQTWNTLLNTWEVSMPSP